MARTTAMRCCRFGDLPGWEDDRHGEALAAFRRSANHRGRYRNGAIGAAFDDFSAAYAAATALGDSVGHDEARHFFERHFEPYRVAETGFVTGFYEPVAEASLQPDARFRFPVYGVPADLVEISEAERPATLDPELRFARRANDGRLVEYFDRAAIEQGALAGRGLEIAWLADPVDLFFIHVQGAARLRLADGSERRISYAAKSGHAFTGPGRVLSDLGEIAREAVTMQSIRAWFARHPHRINEILWRNQSFIFFREAAVDDPALGPIAAAKVPLTPGRSLAVDRLLHTFSTPFYIVAPDLDAFGSAPFRRLMIAQDTGSAIVGPARGDLFTGSGDPAGEIAGVIRHAADFYCLLPRNGRNSR